MEAYEAHGEVHGAIQAGVGGEDHGADREGVRPIRDLHGVPPILDPRVVLPTLVRRGVRDAQVRDDRVLHVAAFLKRFVFFRKFLSDTQHASSVVITGV